MLKMQDVVGILYNTYYFIVIQYANFAPVNPEAGTRVSPKDNPISLLAPCTIRKFSLIRVSKGPYFKNVTTNRGDGLSFYDGIGEEDPPFGFSLALVR
tara:strand:+ start:1262 stop:1555 length:294 start_codon:yes stop_codon:yes gene_type:complete